MAAPATAPRQAAPRKAASATGVRQAPARKPASATTGARQAPARKPAPRKGSTKSAAPTRAQRNARALANARSTQRAAAAPATRPRPRPGPARRKSGAATRQRTAPAASPVARVLNSRGMPLLDRILRGPAWVVMLGILLAGIVFLNVSVLELNRGIARTDAKAAELERTNSTLRTRVAKLDSGERIQALAEERGYVMPEPGQVTFLRGRPTDAKLASQRIVPPAESTTTTPTTTTPTTTATTAVTTATTPTTPVTPAPTATTSTATTQTGYTTGAEPSGTTTQVP